MGIDFKYLSQPRSLLPPPFHPSGWAEGWSLWWAALSSSPAPLSAHLAAQQEAGCASGCGLWFPGTKAPTQFLHWKQGSGIALTRSSTLSPSCGQERLHLASLGKRTEMGRSSRSSRRVGKGVTATLHCSRVLETFQSQAEGWNTQLCLGLQLFDLGIIKVAKGL